MDQVGGEGRRQVWGTSGGRSLLTGCPYSRVPKALLLTEGPDPTASRVNFSLLYLPNTEVYNKRKEK